LHIYEVGGGLGIRTRFDWVVVGAVAVFVGRFQLVMAHHFFAGHRRRGTGVTARGSASGTRWVRSATVLGVLRALALPFLPFSSRYLVDLGVTVLIYVMLGWGLNVVVGLAGLLDLGYVAFYAVGAYSFALLAQNFGAGFWQALPISGLVSASFGVILGFPVLRLRGDYLAIVTLGFGEIIRIVLLNWSAVTGGPNGIVSIPRPSFFGMPFARSAADGGRHSPGSSASSSRPISASSFSIS